MNKKEEPFKRKPTAKLHALGSEVKMLTLPPQRLRELAEYIDMLHEHIDKLEKKQSK